MLFLRLYVELTKGAAGSAELENREIDVMTDGDYLLPVMTYSALFLEVVFWWMVVKTLFWDMIMKRINFKAQVLPRALTSVEAFLAEVDPPNLVEFDLDTWRFNQSALNEKERDFLSQLMADTMQYYLEASTTFGPDLMYIGIAHAM